MYDSDKGLTVNDICNLTSEDSILNNLHFIRFVVNLRKQVMLRQHCVMVHVLLLSLEIQ